MKSGIAVTLVLIVLGLIVALYVLLVLRIGGTWEVRGQIGDSFGALNALFSGGALVGVIIAVMLQRRELGLQRNELELQRSEMVRHSRLVAVSVVIAANAPLATGESDAAAEARGRISDALRELRDLIGSEGSGST